KKQKKDVYDSRPADTTARGLKSTTTSLEAVQNFVSNIQNEERQQVATYLEGSYDEDEDEDYEEGDDDDNDGQDEDFDEDEDLEEDLLDDAGNNQEEKEKVNSTNSSQHNLPHTATQFQPSKIDSPTTPSNSALASETPKKPRTVIGERKSLILSGEKNCLSGPPASHGPATLFAKLTLLR
ncbi:hypothetical protein C9374_014761, partial [Naegleria lovaniensis]